MKTYTALNRRKIQAELGSHNPIDKDEIEGWCDFCPNSIRQDQEHCTCGAPVVWYSSPLWRMLYGDPRKKEQALRMIVPEDDAGKFLMQSASLAGFANKTENEKWKRAVRFFSQDELRDIVTFCRRKTSNRGLIAYVLNTTEKRRRESPRKPTPKKDIPPADAGKGKPRRRAIGR